MSGLAAAGALPAPLQRGAASVASAIAIDLPAPAAIPTPDVRNPQAPHARDGQLPGPPAVPAPSPVVDTGAGAPDAEPGAAGADSIPDPIVPPLSDLPVVELPNPS